jgi:hypothetical protein
MGYWIDGYFSPFCHELCNRSLNNLSVLFVFQIHNVTAKYIMKTDDDTFVRVDKVLTEIKATSVGQGLYMGSMNEFHRPLRTGKWAVTFEVHLIFKILFLFCCSQPPYIITECFSPLIFFLFIIIYNSK